jgi:hypothetical protein
MSRVSSWKKQKGVSTRKTTINLLLSMSHVPSTKTLNV